MQVRPDWVWPHQPERRAASGTPPILTPPVIATVRAAMKGQHRRSTRKTAAVLREKKHIDLSYVSVWTAARHAGLAPYHKPKKPLLTDAHCERRISFVRLYLHTNWRHVLFTDETTFTL